MRETRVSYQEKDIVCQMKKNIRARSLRLTIKQNGSVCLTLPFFVPYRQGQSFLEKQKKWIFEKIQSFQSQPKSLISSGNKKEYRLHKENARKHIEKRLAYFQSLYPVQWTSVSVRNQSTRWGSCSSRGHLSFNYRVLFLPERLGDYVIVHELCHLQEMNHSPRFWSLVAKVFPDYRELRRQMRLL